MEPENNESRLLDAQQCSLGTFLLVHVAHPHSLPTICQHTIQGREIDTEDSVCCAHMPVMIANWINA